MKAFMVLAFVAAAAAAPEPPSGYSFPNSLPQAFGGYGDSGNNGNTVGNIHTSGGQVHRHVYVHVAPDDPEDQQGRVIRIPGKGDKHVNIIFVKTPSQSASAQTEVILPEQDEQKNIVYVLLRKFNAETDLKIRAPRPTAPAKPEVFFIRYKNNEQGGNNGQQYGPPPQAPRPAYGAPF